MAKKKQVLDIFEYTNESKGFWVANENNPYSKAKIDDNSKKLKEDKDSKSQNIKNILSIPSPFARMQLFEIALKKINDIALKKIEDHKEEVEPLFLKLISETLDVFEILFRMDELNIASRIKYYTVDAGQILQKWKTTKGSKQRDKFRKNFSETLNLFHKKHLTIITFDNKVLAGTSSVTGFFTAATPNDIDIEYKGYKFFEDHKALEFRENDFKIFMKSFINELKDDLVDFLEYVKNNTKEKLANTKENYTKIDDFIFFRKAEKDILFEKKTISEEIKIEESNCIIDSKKINGAFVLPLNNYEKYKDLNYYGPTIAKTDFSDITISNERGYIDFKDDFKKNTTERKLTNTSEKETQIIIIDDFLEANIIKMPYKIDSELFFTGSKEPIDCLLPIKQKYFDFFTIEDLKKYLSISNNGSSYTVILKIPTNKVKISELERKTEKENNTNKFIEFERSYEGEAKEKTDKFATGGVHKIESALFFGLYPFFKVTNMPQYNDYYEAILYRDKGLDATYDQSKLTCSFFEVGKIKEIESTIHTERDSIIKRKYYKITNKDGNINIDYIKIFHKLYNSLIIPLFEKKEIINKESKTIDTTVAFDIGTSNTFIAYQIGNAEPKKFDSYVVDEKPNFIMLHNILSDENTFDSFNIKMTIHGEFGDYSTRLFNEFLPQKLDNKTFPITTALICKNKFENTDTNENSLEQELWTKANVAFGYKKDAVDRSIEQVVTNLKWEKNNKKLLKIYIEQLALMMRNKIICEGRNPAITKVIWLKPLSMHQEEVTKLENNWLPSFKYFYSKGGDGNLKNLSESIAPIYYYKNKFNDSLLNLDIGGGTTDISFGKIKGNNIEPIFATSIHFAGNDIFGDLSFSNKKEGNPRKNGIFQYFEADYKKFYEDKTKKKDFYNIYEALNNPNEKRYSEEFINFMFSDPEYNLENKLINNDAKYFRSLFLMHNAAIFWFAAQMIKKTFENDDQNKLNIGFTGNGSKILYITDGSRAKSENSEDLKNVKKLIKAIFKAVLKKTIEIEYPEKIKDGKEATAFGVIKAEEFDVNDDDFYHIPIGDGETIIKSRGKVGKNEYVASNIRPGKEGDSYITASRIDKVAKNVEDFYKWFFKQFTNEAEISFNNIVKNINNPLEDNNKLEKMVELDNIKKQINYALKTVYDDKEIELHDTLFFYPIKQFIYEAGKEQCIKAKKK